MDIPKTHTGACPVQFFAEDERSEFNRGGLPSSIPEGYLTGVQKTKTKRANSTPFSPFPISSGNREQIKNNLKNPV